jgi:hypothetical protein
MLEMKIKEYIYKHRDHVGHEIKEYIYIYIYNSIVRGRGI